MIPSLDTPVEELVATYPQAIRFLAEHHVLCIVCGEVFWGTEGQLLAQKAVGNPDRLVEKLNAFLGADLPGQASANHL